MALSVQITIIALGVIMITFVLRAAIQKNITESHALIWIFPCILIILGGLFPQLTQFLSYFFDTEYAPGLIFTLAIIILYIILFQDFKTLSILTLKNKELASHVTLLTGRVERLERELEAAKQEIEVMAEQSRLAAVAQNTEIIAAQSLVAATAQTEIMEAQSLAAATQEMEENSP